MDADWTGTKPEDWINRIILSQYGIVCKVLDATQEGTKILLKCQSFYNDKIWNWDTYKISLITKEGEILDYEGVIYGKVNKHKWELYPEEKYRKLTPEEIEVELKR